MVHRVIIPVSDNEMILLELRKIGEWTTYSSSSSSSKSRVDQQRVNFSFTYSREIRDRYQDVYLPMREQQPRLTNHIAGVNIAKGFNPVAVEVLERQLGGWDLPNYWRKVVIERVLEETVYILESVSPGCDVLGVSAKVLIIQEPSASMVPATSSSIQLLERKILTARDIDGTTNYESCRICLEEFSAGCQVKCMPCSHAFHGDCIVQWLMINHYCPLCRFEMPTHVLDVE